MLPPLRDRMAEFDDASSPRKFTGAAGFPG